MSKIMKERPVGTVFNWYGKRLKVVEDSYRNDPCRLCVFDGKNCEHRYCSRYNRKDDIDIHYKEVKNEN